MADVTETERAYFAGFFDGEGCVAAYRGGRYVVSLTNCDVRPLVRARDLWGGYVSRQKAETRRGALRDLWRWQIYGQKSRQFLEMIRPFSRIKREQIDTYLSVLRVLPVGRGARRHAGATAVIEAGAVRLRLLKREAV
jgi:hypothetical protein